MVERQTNDPLNYLGVRSPTPANFIEVDRAPLTTDVGFDIGTTWLDTSSGVLFALTSVQNKSANWEQYSGSTGNPAVSPFIVSAAGLGNFTTVQEGLDAANAAGGDNTVYVQPGTYVEDLTLYPTVSIVGTILNNTIIDGTHTPTTTGDISFQNLNLQSSSDIISSTASGNTGIAIIGCSIGISNAFIFNLPNWNINVTTPLRIEACNDLASSANGIMSGDGALFIKNSQIGIGSTIAMNLTGFATIEGSNIGCPVDSSGVGLESISVDYMNGITFSGASQGFFTYCRIEENSSTGDGLILNGTGTCTLSNVVLSISISPAIGGTGSSLVIIGSIVFILNSDIAGSFTIAYSNLVHQAPTAIGGDLSLIESGSVLGIEGGTVTDFIGQTTLVAGTSTVANTSIIPNDRINLTREGINTSTALGDLSYSIAGGASFTITARDISSPATVVAADVSTVSYFITREL